MFSVDETLRQHQVAMKSSDNTYATAPQKSRNGHGPEEASKARGVKLILAQFSGQPQTVLQQDCLLQCLPRDVLF